MIIFAYILTSFSYIICFPGFNFSFAAWFCLVPLIFAVDLESDAKVVFRKSFLCGWIIFLGSMYWLAFVSWLGYILVSLYLALYIGLFGIIRYYHKQFIVIPLAWTALEFIRANLFGGMPWLLLGASQHDILPIIQISSVTGVYGVSFFAAMINAVIAHTMGPARDNETGNHVFFRWVITFAVLISVVLYGYSSLARLVGDKKIKVGVVQPNIPQELKWDPTYAGKMLDKLEALSRNITGIYKVRCGGYPSFKIDLAMVNKYLSKYKVNKKERTQIIIWPETAAPEFTESRETFRRICDLAREFNSYFIIGSQGVEGRNGRDKKYFNSAFLVSNEGRVVDEYRKIHLVPFGEFVPFVNIFPFLKSFTPVKEGFTAGKEYVVFKIPISENKLAEDGSESAPFNLNSSVLICFEDIFPGIAREFVRNGAEVLVNLTNDGWFGETNAASQHAYLSVFRAVENGVPMVRSTNTGLSCFVDSNGQIFEVPMFIGIGSAKEIPVLKRDTFYTKYGDVFGWLCSLLFCFIIVFQKKI